MQFDPETAEARCALCSELLAEAVLVHREPDRFERSVGITEEGYRRAWRRCPCCQALVGVQRPEHARALSALAANYYEVDLGNQIGAKYHRIMGLPPERSDNAGRVERVVAACRRLIPGASELRLVIDIGGGTGVFLSKFLGVADGGWRGIAVEPDPLAVAHLRALGLFEVHPGRFEAPGSLPPADLITLNKVIEHVDDPLPMLQLAAQALVPTGIAYVEVPDALTACHRPPEDNILGALHRHLYEPGTLARLLQRAGLVALEVARIVEPSGKLTVYAFAGRSDTFGLRCRAPEVSGRV